MGVSGSGLSSLFVCLFVFIFPKEYLALLGGGGESFALWSSFCDVTCLEVHKAWWFTWCRLNIENKEIKARRGA